MSMSSSRLESLDRASLVQRLDQGGCAILRSLLQTEPFCAQVIMARHGFGRGEYTYLRYPLPTPIARLSCALPSRFG